MFKKKFLGLKTVVLLLFLLLSLLGLSSTCYALTPISDFSLEDYTLALQRCYDDWDMFYDMNSTKKTWLYNTIHSSSNMTSTFNTLKNKFLSTDIQYVEQISVTMNSNYIYFILNNNTIGNSLPHIEISQQYGSSYVNYYVRCIDDSKNYVNFIAFCVDIANAQSSIVNQNLTNGNAIQVRMKLAYPFSFVSGSSVFGSNGFYNLHKVGNFYLNPSTSVSYSSGYYWNTNDYVINYQEPEPEPEPQPSGDSSGDSGGSGVITNPSGEVTGNIDLTGIENSLNSIENKIPTSGDISSAVGQATEDYWGSSGDLSGDEQENEISSYIDDVMTSLSGELMSNAVFSEMENAEDIFLDFFRNQEDESFYDLIISWDTISPVISMYNGSVTVSSQSIISGDSINFSALCRNNETLGQIQQYIRIIFNFTCTIALIWQIYNLILSTLGIDNPYLYEDSDLTDVVNPSTGENYTRMRTYKRVFRKWW